MSDTEFLPCPFCGRQVGYITSNAAIRSEHKWRAVVCDPCGIEGPGAWSAEEAKRRWNCRGTIEASGFQPNERVTDGELLGTVVEQQGRLTLVYWDAGARSTIETKELQRCISPNPAP